MSRLRAALINFSPQYGDVEANLASVERQVKSLAADGVQLACYPEMCLTGYECSPQILEHALKMSDRAVLRLARLANETGTALLVGMPEWEPAQKRAHITQLCCLPAGEIFPYRKTHLRLREAQIFSAGEEPGVFRFSSFTLGVQLCYEAHFPELSLAQALAGVQVIVVCSASPMGSAAALRERWLRYLPARAYDTGSYVLTCNQNGASPSGLAFSGLALAFDPDGDLIAETQAADLPLLVDLETQSVEEARRKRSFLRHRRPELYRL